MATRVEMIIETLKANPDKKFTARDWQSANRIVSENRDFHHYIEQVGIDNQTGRLIKSAWNK
ncbi:MULTISPECIES: hypothetical protein [unclassified Vibrio]|uniref:hypothetical protein n=1 Tax=unclassified Vibrio TaxID=2614977 RepID=UPI001929FE07|nr:MULTISPECIES: hypothetical protein [unclassified Vibrio]